MDSLLSEEYDSVTMLKQRLNEVIKDFKLDLKPKYIMPNLVDCGIVTEEERKSILSLKSTEDQVEKLFEILPSKEPKRLDDFKNVLSMEDEFGTSYPWLAEKLDSVLEMNFPFEIEQKKDLNENVQKLLINGEVPFQTNCLLKRQSKIEEIRSKLIKAANQRHWVYLHGMSGTGKSVLAAEAIRDNDLIRTYFYEGVFWVKLGNLDENSLEIKMVKLNKRILESKKDIAPENKNISKFENLKDLNKNLKKSVTTKMLIILDDLWDQPQFNTIALLDIGCPILVTTKFPGLFDSYSSFSSPIPLTNDLSLDEGKELLSMYTNCDKENLPSVVDYICRKCKGSLFTLSHIGKWVAPFKNDIKRWNHLKNIIDKGSKSSLLKQNRQRHASDTELTYDEIKNIIESTLEAIPEYKDLFYDFVIFPEDVWVPTQVFSVLWDIQDEIEIQDKMYNLLQNSLLQHENDSIYSYSYGIHDLYLEILKDICSEDEKNERHLKLVKKYLQFCRINDGSYNFNLLPDDDYIHYYIAHHMSFLDQKDIPDGITLDDIFFDLHFIEKKLRKDPKDILWDYQNYRDMFKNKEFLDIFKAFAAKHAYNIFTNKDCDIIQLGLFEPQNSIIYNKAFDIASESMTKSYFLWCNQEENQSHIQNLNSKLNAFENTKHAAISSDGLLVACVGNGNKAVISSSSSGEELSILSGHANTINYCIFNSCANKLVTTSKDKTVRIFELNIAYTADMKPTKKRGSQHMISTEPIGTPDLAIITYAKHFASVLSCCYSHDEDLIVSSDDNGHAHVWQSSTGYCKSKAHHLSRDFQLRPVKSCCFNSDSTLFGTAAYDSIKLWFVKDGMPYCEFSHDEMAVTGFCITKNNCLVSVANNDVYKHYIESKYQEKFKCPKNLILTCCCLSPDNNYLACGTTEDTVIVFLVNSGKITRELKGSKSDILSVMYTENGKKLLAVCKEGYFLYDMSIVQDTSLVSCEGNLSVQQNLNELTIASSNFFESLEIRKGYTGRLEYKTKPEYSEITACSLSNDCKEVVYGTKQGNIKVLNIETKIVDDLPKHLGQINYITHLKSDLFFTCSEDKMIKIWNNKSPKTLKGHLQAVLMCVPFKQSQKLLSCSKDGTLRVWDTCTGQLLFPTEGHGNEDVRWCDISFNEKLLASASADHTVKLWYAENGQIFKTLECGDEVRCCRFSPSFQVLVSGCDSGEVRLWDLAPSKPSFEILYQQSSCVYNIYFSQDGSQLLSISDDIKIWKKGSEPQTLLLPSSSMGVARPSIWASDNFYVIVAIVNSVLYVLKKIDNVVYSKL